MLDRRIPLTFISYAISRINAQHYWFAMRRKGKVNAHAWLTVVSCAVQADQSNAMLNPLKPLKTGLGGEIISPSSLGHHGLADRLKEPDLLDVDVTIKRTQLADDAGVFELAIEAAESVKAKGSVQKMLSHQLAGAHHHAMRLLDEADKQRDPMIKAKLMNTSTRLMEAFCKGALTLQKLQIGASQIVTVQHVQINGGQAIIGNVGQR